MKKRLCVILITAALVQTACSSNQKMSGGAGDTASYQANYASGSSGSVNPAAAVMEEAVMYDDYDYQAMEAEIYDIYPSPEEAFGERAYDGGYSESGADIDGAPAASPLKIIKTASVELRTDKFDETVEWLRSVGPDLGGYVENAEMRSQYVYQKNAVTRVYSITIRVPSGRFEEALYYVENLAELTHSNQSSEDVTSRYFDLAGRLETKLIEEERVLEMIGLAEEVEDLLALEERLGDIRTRIELYKSQMTSIDRLAAFSTIYANLTEVTTEELVIVSDDLTARIQTAFIRSVNGTAAFFQNVVIFLAGALIPFIVISVLIFVFARILIGANRKRRGKTA